VFVRKKDKSKDAKYRNSSIDFSLYIIIPMAWLAGTLATWSQETAKNPT
jgi:hypothetical protein